MSSDYWTITQAPLRDIPGGRVKLLDLPSGSFVKTTGEIDRVTESPDGPMIWKQVDYAGSLRGYRGWVYAEFLEPYVNEFYSGVVHVAYPTVEPNDAAQYMIWKGNKQYNLCGEFCVCHIVGEDIDVMLAKWEAKEVSVFRRVFGSGKSRGTSPDEVNNMLSVYGYMPSMRLDKGLRDPVLKRPLVSPGRMAKLLEAYRGIVGVKISSASGNLQSSGILHWVV